MLVNILNHVTDLINNLLQNYSFVFNSFITARFQSGSSVQSMRSFGKASPKCLDETKCEVFCCDQYNT